MQKRKIEDNKIWEAYNRILNGESLTRVANSEDIGLDRGTLKRYIEKVVFPSINPEQKNKFDQIINKNFRGNSTEQKRLNRNKKRENGEKKIKESEEIIFLADHGVTPKQIEYLYKRLMHGKRTTVSRDTYIFKCAEHLKKLSQLGFTTEQVFTIFMKRPKLFTGSPEKIIKIFNSLLEEHAIPEKVIYMIVEDPWIDLRKKTKEQRKLSETEIEQTERDEY